MTDEAQTEEEAKSLGLERWVQFAFVAIAGVVFFLGNKILPYAYEQIARYTEEWANYRLPHIDPTIMMGICGVLAILVGYFGYRHKKLSPIAHEVATELSKVTWPSRQETWYSTIVVLITAALASVYVGLFDALWSAFTDLIYKTS